MNVPELVTLARRINSREETIQQLRRRTVGCVNETLCEVLLQGQDLLEMKARCRRGDWTHWLRVNCPTVGLRSAQRYMALAAHGSGGELQEADSLRAALSLCNLEGEAEKTEPKRWPAYQETILRISKLRGYVERNPIKAWPKEGIEKAQEELEPIARELWPDKFTMGNGPTPH
jgi:hypothetical protein